MGVGLGQENFYFTSHIYKTRIIFAYFTGVQEDSKGLSDYGSFS